jgi:DNA polymerase
MVKGSMAGYPMGLNACAKAMDIGETKQKGGNLLINFFSVPQKNGLRNLPEVNRDKWELFKEYCIQDVVVEREVRREIDYVDFDKEEYARDQKINSRGIRVDTDLVEAALKIRKTVQERMRVRFEEITGIANPKARNSVALWLEKKLGHEVKSVAKGVVQALIGEGDAEVKEALTIKSQLGMTSLKKYDVLQNSTCNDGRIKGTLQYYGSTKGRWSGRLLQVQNLKQNHLACLEKAIQVVKDGEIEIAELIWGDINSTLSQLIRPALIPSEGNVFHVADYSAIEARVLAWISGETWRNEVFRTHGKIYEASAAKMYKCSIGEVTKAMRAKGKICELALGYGGGSKALGSMGGAAIGLTEPEMVNLVEEWRNSNKQVTWFWYNLNKAFMQTILTGKPHRLKGLTIRDEHCKISIELPSGRKIYYQEPDIIKNKWGTDGIVYSGQSTLTKQWGEQKLYGGKLAENVCQAIARDCLAIALKDLDDMKIVFHVHDELIIEDPGNPKILSYILLTMGKRIEWAPGLILTAEGFISEFYKKEG